MKKLLEQELDKIKISEEQEKYLKDISNKVMDVLRGRLNKRNIDASLFVGGSLAKDTIIRKRKQDIDVFIRFNKKYSEEEIKNIMKKLFFRLKISREKIKVNKQHGSRNYYKINFKKSGIDVEVIPTVKISKPEQARNLTDLSYFHVNYVKKKIDAKKKLADEIRLAKSFAHGQDCYGAESYIKGFSGYALEILVIYYGSFVKFLKAMSELDKKVIIDPEKKYKSKQDVLKSLNETKLKSPIILIDPTFKERNAARALSLETFRKFQKSAREFLEKGDEEFFEPKKIDIYDLLEKAKEEKGAFVVFEISTNKQPGDIAGTKLLKFSKFLKKEVRKYFDILDWDFDYKGFKKAQIYGVLKRKKERVLEGPRIERKEAVVNFKKKHPVWYIEERKIKCALPTDVTLKDFMKDFKKIHKKTIKQMSVKKIKLI